MNLQWQKLTWSKKIAQKPPKHRVERTSHGAQKMVSVWVSRDYTELQQFWSEKRKKQLTDRPSNQKSNKKF